MLDDLRYINKVDKSDALGFAAKQPQQLLHKFNLTEASSERAPVHNVVFSGMGGSSLAAELARTWPKISVPFVVCKGYELPEWVNENTLVICASYSGNTEETLASLEEALKAKTQIVIITHGGKLLERANEEQIDVAVLPQSPQPRTGILYAYRALVEVLVSVGLLGQSEILELESVVESLEQHCLRWAADVPEENNLAKQIANHMLGKTAIIYGGPLTYPAAYKWKISVNENAKNTAWSNQLPEFNHNEFIGWSSHPVEKPFAVFDLQSSFENPRITERFEVSDRLLSGRRPKAFSVKAEGATVLEQQLYLVLLGDHATTYLAVLNNVDPTPIDLVERFKKELS